MLTDKLKELTKTNHQLLEKKLVAKMRSLRGNDDYINLLGIFYSYFGGLEKLMQSHLLTARVPDYSKRRKAEALASDIEVLGGKLPELATTDSLPNITNHAEAMGALYVMEGSTLGGKIISEMLTKQLGLNDGLSFFRSYGDETMMMWKQFQSVLNEPELSAGTEVVAAANETFLKFSEWFD
jgi:heme oxygenase